MPRLSARLLPRLSIRLADYVVDCAWSPDGSSLAAALGDGSIELIDLPGAGAPRRIGTHALGALSLDWFGDGAVLCSSGQDGTLKFWSTRSETAPTVIAARQWTTRVLRRPGHPEVAAATGRSIALWSANATRLQEFGEQTSVVHGIAWSHDGKLFAAACTGSVAIWRWDGASIQTTRLAWPGVSLTVAFSPNARYVAAGMQDGAVRFRRLASQETAELSGYPSKVDLIGWTANSRFLATAAAQDVIFWDFSGKGPEGREPARAQGHTDRIVALASHPHRPLVASAGRDWRVLLWAPGVQQQPADVLLTAAEPAVLRWSQDGQRLAVGQTNGELAIYELMTG